MDKSLNIFGTFYRQERQQLRLSLWKVAMSSRMHIRNIQRIEAGEQHPGIAVAMRLVDALGISQGQFFSSLVKANLYELPASISPLEKPEITYQIPDLVDSFKAAYGALLFQARTQALVSQTAMAKAAGYSLRNINSVEAGKQEPAIITAIALLMATGADVEQFFNQLHEYRKFNI